MTKIWRLREGSGPLVATAIHDGHQVRKDVENHLALSDAARLREEDPFTGGWTSIAPTQVVSTHSRFEVDLNRPRDKAVYRRPEDAWGLTVWKDDPPAKMFETSLREYDAFYDAMRELLSDISRKHGRFVVFDLHSYNHLREGPNGPPADVEGNPQVNIGTGTMDRERWGPVVDALIGTLASCDFPGGNLDVRENVKFKGGNWSRWVHENFPETGVSIAVEFKKFFMDEWSGEPNTETVEAIRGALEKSAAAVLDALATL